MIKVKDLEVVVASNSNNKKKILNQVSLDFEVGQNYCLLGKNGSGKSTLSSVLMGSPKYEVVGGEILIDSLINSNLDHPLTPSLLRRENNGINLLELSPEERSKAGIFLSFQNVPEIPGIKLVEYLRIIYNISKKVDHPQPNLKDHPQPLLAKEGSNKVVFKDLSPFVFKRYIKKYLKELNIEGKFLLRDLNVGFSGGEKRKIEILQMKLINPKYIILDEIDSGLDLDAFKSVANELKKISSPENTLIIITHYFKILEYIDVDKVYVLKDGKVDKEGGKELIDDVVENGFE